MSPFPVRKKVRLSEAQIRPTVYRNWNQGNENILLVQGITYITYISAPVVYVAKVPVAKMPYCDESALCHVAKMPYCDESALCHVAKMPYVA